ncbi:carotenoid biosynthesis protein [bacterium]|nr:carotenoid biosynthesis protein [bacterium]
MKKMNIPVCLVYLLFGFGGFWHMLDQFQSAMRTMTAPSMILVSLMLMYDVLKSVSKESKNRFLFWCLCILLGGWGAEYVGVNTHFPFGNYQYGTVLEPRILEIPIAIGFAWLSICLSSLMITCKTVNREKIKNSFSFFIIPVFTAILMLLFDTVMENAATKLEYWMWNTNSIPIQNYLSWFSLGLLFSTLWLRLKISLKHFSNFGIHVYLSQFAYFILVLLK